MAEPTQGELYSLLGEVTADSYRNKAEEERKLRRQLRRDQYKAMLLQPLVGAIATTGLETLGNVASNLVLGDKAKSFLNTEAGRSALAKSKENALFAKKIDDEHTIYSAPNAITTWESQISDDLILKSGTTDESEKSIIRSTVAKDRKENEKFLKEHLEDLEKQKLFLATFPTEKQIRDRAVAKDPDNYFARSKISKLLAKGGSYLGGKSIDELMERSTNWILTGSPDSEYAESISKTFKTGKGRQIFVDLIEASLEGDDSAIDTAVLALQGSPFYKAIAAKTGQKAENIAKFSELHTRLNSTITQVNKIGIKDTVYHKLLAHPEYEEVLQNRDPVAFENLFNKIIFGSSEDVKNLGSTLLRDETFLKTFNTLKTEAPDTRKTNLDLIVKEEVSFISNVLARDVNDVDFNLGAYTPAVIKRGLRSYLSKQITNEKITIDKESGILLREELPESVRIENLKYSIKEAHRFVTTRPIIKQGIDNFISTLTQGMEKLKLNDELSVREKNNQATAALANARTILEQSLEGIMPPEELAKYESFEDALIDFEDSIAEDFYFTPSPQERRPWLERAANIEYKNTQTYQNEKENPSSLLEKPLPDYPAAGKGTVEQFVANQK